MLSKLAARSPSRAALPAAPLRTRVSRPETVLFSRTLRLCLQQSAGASIEHIVLFAPLAALGTGHAASSTQVSLACIPDAALTHEKEGNAVSTACDAISAASTVDSPAACRPRERGSGPARLDALTSNQQCNVLSTMGIWIQSFQVHDSV
ncbi:hypothetical protein M432DRAFT_620451 [Thermoascus aurantiacus ATCC 26904]